MTTAITVSSEFGLVVRRAALSERKVTLNQLLAAMEVLAPLSENEELLSFGPHFGGEAASEFVTRLESLGLIHIDDFFVLAVDVPEWVQLSAAFRVGQSSGSNE